MGPVFAQPIRPATGTGGAMAHLTVRLLGPFQVTLDGQPVTGFETEKGQALLAYLAYEPDRSGHRLDTLWEA